MSPQYLWVTGVLLISILCLRSTLGYSIQSRGKNFRSPKYSYLDIRALPDNLSGYIAPNDLRYYALYPVNYETPMYPGVDKRRFLHIIQKQKRAMMRLGKRAPLRLGKRAPLRLG